MAARPARCQTRIMTDTPRESHPQPQRPDQITRFFDWIRSSGLNRDGDRWIAGVCGGVAARTGLDPLIVRGIFVVVAILGGPVVFVYAVAWALLPRGIGRIYTEDAIRGRFEPAMIAIGALLLFTIPGLSNGIGWNGPGFWALPDWLDGLFALGWGLAITAGIIWLIVVLVRRAKRTGRSSGAGPSGSTGPSDPFGPGSVYDQRPPAGPAPYNSASPQSDAATMSAEPAAPNTSATTTASTTTNEAADGDSNARAGIPPFADAGTDTTAAFTPTTGASYAPSTATYAPSTDNSAKTIRAEQNRYWQEQNRARQAAKRAHIRARRPGSGYSAIVLGLALSTGAVAAGVNANGAWSLNAVILGVAFALGVLALGIVIAGVRGRTTGAMGLFAWAGAITLIVLGVFPQGTQFAGIGSNVWPLSANSAMIDPGSSYAMIAGESILDLGDFDNPGLQSDRTIDIWLGAGETTLRLPADAPVRVEARTLAGGVEYAGRAVAAENGERLGLFTADKRTFNSSSSRAGPLLRIWTLTGVVTLASSNN